jgi:hypothetical protein
LAQIGAGRGDDRSRRLSPKSRVEHRDQAVRLRDDLAPACPYDVPAGELQVEVAPAVALEGERMIVGSAAVGLDNETGGRPVEVDLVSGDETVDDRRRQTCQPNHLEEAPFELAPDERRLVGELGEQAAQRPRAAPAVRAGEGVLERSAVEAPQDERLLERTMQQT